MYEGLYYQYAPTTPFGPVTLHSRLFINNDEFEVGKEEYTLSFTIQFDGLSKTFTFKYGTTNNGLPAICIHGQTLDNNVSIYPKFNYQIETHFDIVKSSNTILNSMTVTGDNIGTFQSNSNTVWGYTPDSVEDKTLNITINADFPIFSEGFSQSYSDELDRMATEIGLRALATNYLPEIASGDYTHTDLAINYGDISNEIPSDRTYFIKSSLKVNGNMTTQKGYCFQILPEAKICLYQDDNVSGDASPNLHLIISEFPCRVKGYDEPDSDYTDASSVDANYWHSGYWKDLNTGVNYTGICSTNIPIFRGQENAQRYLNGEISESDALNGGIFANKDSTIGDELTSSDIPAISLSTSGIGSFAYALSGTQLAEIMEDYLYTDNTNLQDTMKEALWAWGNNPIDFLIDCYYVPFSITHFYDTINANLKFGSYQFPNTSYPAIKETNGNRLVLFNTTFEGVYGDWRDFTQFNYDLFLPFIGFVPLDVQKYLNKQVRCEMMFDISTHNLRYYLFVDNKITDRFDGSVGINIPLMATDIVNKAKHDRDIQYGLVSDALSAGTQIGMAVTSADFGGMATGLVGGINTIVNGVKKYQELNNRASSGVNGSFSSSMNVYDISYAYLRITERQMILPSELNSVYNFPSYYIGTLSNLSGYCEIEDIQLKSTCSEYEYNEIKTLLKGGVIF